MNFVVIESCLEGSRSYRGLERVQVWEFGGPEVQRSRSHRDCGGHAGITITILAKL